MSNPSAGMNYLINVPGAVDTFCDSFKSLRNQNNVNQILEIASILSMFTGVGGMIAKGGGILAKGIRVSNIALAGTDSLSIIDSVTNARDLALSHACAGGDTNLCETYMNSDRNFTLAVTGLVLNVGALPVSASRKLISQFRQTMVLRNGDNARAMIADYDKFSSLLTSASKSQQETLAKLLSNRNLSSEEMNRFLSLLQNNTNDKTLAFLDDLSKLDERTQGIVLSKILEKSKDSGGVCSL